MPATRPIARWSATATWLSSEKIARAVGARLRELRIDAEMSMREMALAIGSHREIIGRIESGRHEVSLETVSRYARALGLDVATVLVCLDDEWRAADQTGRGE